MQAFLNADQEATVRTRHGTMDWFKIGKGRGQGYILSPCLFNLYKEYIMWNAGLDEAQAGIKIAGRNISNLRHADDTTLMAESKVEVMERVTDFIFLGSKIAEDGDCSQEIKRCLLPGRKVTTNVDSILKKQRHYFANKGPSSQSNSFSSSHVWMWELGYKESWAPKNWCFWTMVLEKILESLGLQGDPTSPS